MAYCHKKCRENANIKITDIKGNLIKTTTAFGGQAIGTAKTNMVNEQTQEFT